MTLFIYIAQRFFWATVFAFAIVLFLATLFDAIELARRGGDEVGGFGLMLSLAAMRAPSISIKAAPFVMLLAAMWTFARLARSSELVVTRAAGVSGWGVTAPAVLSAAALGVFATTIYNPIAAAMLDRYERTEAKLFRGEEGLLSVSQEGLWLRQGDARTQSAIHADKSNGDGTVLGDVFVLIFEDQDRWIGRIDAEAATLRRGYWRLENAVIREVDPNDPNAPPSETALETYDLPTTLTRDKILDSFAPPETIPFWELPGFIQTLRDQGFSARRHVLHLHASLSAPLLFAAMALLGGAFSMRHARLGGLGAMALYATMTGFGVYFIFDIAQALAGSGVIPAIPAAWGPPSAAMMLAAGLLLHFEDG